MFPNGQGKVSYRIANISNPILQPWAAQRMKKPNEDVRAGKNTVHGACAPD
jgi:hypothetical protein